ncbi:hypothetical protein HUU62_04140 [Rhodoferax sp. 4810]|nr:hypothetical protein [Rhodoferax jenense]
MTQFVSYSSYVPTEEVFSTGPALREEAPVHRVGHSNGVVTASSEQATDRGNEGQINPAYGTESWQATATTKTGRPVSKITGDCLVTIGGIQGSVDFFVSEGFLQEDAQGKFSTGTGPKEATQVTDGEHLPVNPEAMSVINAALDPLPQQSLDQITAHGIGVAIGTLDDASLTLKFAQASGLDVADSTQRLTAIKSPYQAHADHALATRSGIGAADKDAFWAWAKANHPRQLQDAVGKQLRSHDVSGYKPLADKWLAINPPSMEAIKANGSIPVRGQEIFIQGQWMSPKAAARAGLV